MPISFQKSYFLFCQRSDSEYSKNDCRNALYFQMMSSLVRRVSSYFASGVTRYDREMIAERVVFSDDFIAVADVALV